MNQYPVAKISLVTPSFNQGAYIEETFKSVIDQNYPHLEHIVLDAGSTDETMSVVDRYRAHLSFFRSAPDDGPADAIAAGFDMSTGELFNWLNSDDILLPGTLLSLGAITSSAPDFDIYAFVGVQSGEHGPYRSAFCKWADVALPLMLRRISFCQESTFLRASFLKKNGLKVDSNLSHVFDTHLYTELLNAGARILFINAFGGVIRHHASARTTHGAPQSDLVALNRISPQHTSRAHEAALLRILGSRFSWLWRPLFRTRIVQRIVGKLVGQAPPIYAFCDFIISDSCSCEEPSAWRITR